MKNNRTQQNVLQKTKREWLIQKRHLLNMSQSEIAIRIGISQNYYSWLEQGKRRPSPQIAKKIGKELEIPWILFYIDNEDSTSFSNHNS